MDKKFNFQELQAIVATLRGENGCPWDKSQTHESLKLYTLEEAYEVNQAVSNLTKTGDCTNLKEELGDLLFQVLLQSQVAEDNGEFAIEDVIDGIARKMIHRHPHVFAGRHYDIVEQQQADWEKLKAQEEGHKQTSLKEDIALIPESFPALIRGEKVAKKAAAAGVLSTNDEDVFKDLLTSVINLQLGTAGEDPEKKFSSDEELSEKLGDTLFALCRFCAKYKVSGEMALLKKLEEFWKASSQRQNKNSSVRIASKIIEKEGMVSHLILFRCAKHFILPRKAKTSEKRVRSF